MKRRLQRRKRNQKIVSVLTACLLSACAIVPMFTVADDETATTIDPSVITTSSTVTIYDDYESKETSTLTWYAYQIFTGTYDYGSSSATSSDPTGVTIEL